MLTRRCASRVSAGFCWNAALADATGDADYAAEVLDHLLTLNRPVREVRVRFVDSTLRLADDIAGE
ncbi:MAG: hypothetical protein AAGK78_10715, partial [Planctomycetota bacterium]